MSTKFKVGQLVRIIPGLQSGDSYGVYCAPAMTNYAGHVFKIQSVREMGPRQLPRYSLVQVKGRTMNGVNQWSWSEDMLLRAISKKDHLVKDISKMGNGIFRVNGVFEGKARICTIKKKGSTVTLIPMDKAITRKSLGVEEFTTLLNEEKINVMCIERFTSK